jgi:murein DD-endopeptidase MepM/ murein hydrolase activator NlpD
MTTLRPLPRFLLAGALITALAGLAVLPRVAFADTSSDLNRAKDDLRSAQAAFKQATKAWLEAENKFHETERAVKNMSRDIARLRAESADAAARLQARAIEAFQTGQASALAALLESGSITDLTDRLEFLGQMAQNDADLVVLLQTDAERIRQGEDELRALLERRRQAAEDLTARHRELDQRVSALSQKVAELTKRLRDEQTILRVLGQHVLPGAPITRCPVHGFNSFVDSFGWPRSGGRTHQGIDLISAYGTPIIAVQSGYASAHPNYLGGNAVIVESSGGDYTYYAHLSRYGTLGYVSAGTIIGYVGATGDTNTPHLHFEYHPRGGSAIDPYAALNAVC